MCGICGVIQIAGDARLPVEQAVLDRMTDAMTHRGPNDRGTHLEPGAALGVRRLSIVDVEGGHQPFADEGGDIWGIQNGELYNHDELREELRGRGHSFRSRCDTEILPHLYEQHGVAFAERLRGKFGLAVWDAKRRRAVVARDRLGIKPLYVACVGDLVVFASELKSLLASGLIPIELDVEAIDAYLTLGFFPAPRTPLAGVEKLMPGERLVVEEGDVRRERYWTFPAPDPQAHGPGGEMERAEELLDVLEESVRLRLMSDVPLGAMLSGGLDSSLVLALMARNTSGPVKTFSVGFTEAGEGNELNIAREVAEHYGAEHHELELSLSGQQVELNDLVWYLDEPLADLSSLGFLALSKLAAETVTVALSGQGADELFGGYSRHRNAALAGRILGLPRPLPRLLTSAAAYAPSRFARVSEVIRASDPVARHLAAHAYLDGTLRDRLLRSELASLHGSGARATITERLRGAEGDPLATMLFLDGQLGLVDDMLHYFDRASMAYSLEVRVPFLDHHVVEFASRVPSSSKVRGMTTKHLLKLAARGVVPHHIIDRPKIGFFNAAVQEWFRAQSAGAISDYLLSPNPRYAELLQPSEVQALVARNAEGSSRGYEHVLLRVLMLEVWLADFVPRAVAASTAAPQRRVEVPA